MELDRLQALRIKAFQRPLLDRRSNINKEGRSIGLVQREGDRLFRRQGYRNAKMCYIDCVERFLENVVMFDFQRKSSPIDIRVGGLSKVKIRAVTALQETVHCSVKGVAQSSGGVAEQPIGIREATSGAINRAITAWSHDPSGDVYFGIESGIIPMIDNEEIDLTIDEPEQLIDTAFIAMWIPAEGILTITKSDGCEFPLEQFWQTKEKPGGFGDNTVGKTLAEQGLVADHADPHLSLMGISREFLIAAAVQQAVAEYIRSACA